MKLVDGIHFDKSAIMQFRLRKNATTLYCGYQFQLITELRLKEDKLLKIK